MARATGIDLRTGDQLEKLAARAEKLGGRGAKNKLVGAIKREIRPVVTATKKRLASDEAWPSGGGLQKTAAQKLRLNSKVRAQATRREAAGVKVIASMERPYSAARRKRLKGSDTKPKGLFIDLPALNSGRLRHPLFGLRSKWYEQRVTPGMWRRAVAPNADQLTETVREVVKDFAAELKKG